MLHNYTQKHIFRCVSWKHGGKAVTYDFVSLFWRCMGYPVRFPLNMQS
jgi:lipoate-protein ligase A